MISRIEPDLLHMFGPETCLTVNKVYREVLHHQRHEPIQDYRTIRDVTIQRDNYNVSTVVPEKTIHITRNSVIDASDFKNDDVIGPDALLSE